MSSVEQITAPRRAEGRMARHGRTVVGVVVSIVALTAVGWWIAHQPAPRFPSSAGGLAWLGLAIAMTLLTLGLRGWRWHRILALTAIDHQRDDAVALTAVGQMGNTVLPARGGDVLRLALLGARSTSRRREILGTLIAERLLDAVVLASVFVVLSLGLADSPASTSVPVLVAGAIVLGFAGLAAYLRLRRSGRFERFAALIRPVARGLRVFAHPRGVALFALSLLIWCVDGMVLLVIAHAIGIDLGPLNALLVLAIASLAAAVPAAPGFAGTFDAAMVLGLSSAAVTGGAAVGLLILARCVFFVPPALVGLLLLVTRYGGLRRVRSPRPS